MYRKIVSIILFGVLLTVSAYAEIAEDNKIDFSQYSVKELLIIRDQINEELENKGYTVYYDLTRGSKGEEVSRLQERLQELNYYEGQISGKYDTVTQKAIKQFKKNNGLGEDANISGEEQLILFSDKAIAKEKTAELSSTTPTPKPTIDPIFAEYKSIDYTECSRYPENFIGTKVLLKGKVVQVLGNRKTGFTVRLATAGGTNDVYYVTIDKDPGFNILEDDKLYVYAVMTGTKTYTSTFDVSITIPSAKADYIELR